MNRRKNQNGVATGSRRTTANNTLAKGKPKPKYRNTACSATSILIFIIEANLEWVMRTSDVLLTVVLWPSACPITRVLTRQFPPVYL